MRSVSQSSFLAAIFVSASFLGCTKNSDSSPIAATHEEPNINKPLKQQKQPIPTAIDNVTKETPVAPATPVKSFSFVAPTSEWTEGGSSEGDGTYTTATFKMTSPNAQLTISSVGLPTNGAKASKLVAECETGFAKGIAQHPDMAREWITKGFSISRYADATNGEVSVWCISRNCKVRLDFAFGAGSKAADNMKAADAATNAFFDKNPAGGAVLK